MPRFICDLHIHSRYAQGCSKETTIALLEQWARVKGVDVLGTGDFTHPKWREELQRELVQERDGVLFTKSGYPFLLTTELSLVYTQDGRGRRVHVLLLAPSWNAVDRITAYLLAHGRIDYDGRPIFKIPAWRLVKDLAAIDAMIEVIPAHAWTPWFSLFGSKSGFDSLRECFLDQTDRIHAIETGLSSDIAMNDRLSQLEGVRFVSFSDAHSYWPWRLGREATIFELQELTYPGIIDAIRTGEGLWGTIEVEPSYGKYHVDGHRACNVRFEPAESRLNQGKCPVCGGELTIGVLSRVEELADRKARDGGESQRSLKLLPLHEILSLVLGKGMATKTVTETYGKLLATGKHEYDVLLNVPEATLAAASTPALAKAIVAVRNGEVSFTPGYDGVYGVPSLAGVSLPVSKAREVSSDDASRTSETRGRVTIVDPERKGRKGKADGAPKVQKGLGDFI